MFSCSGSPAPVSECPAVEPIDTEEVLRRTLEGDPESGVPSVAIAALLLNAGAT
jgi:hypothetical protein